MAYGDLLGTGHDGAAVQRCSGAAVNVWCTNTGGTAEGQIRNSWVIFSGTVGTVHALGVLLPRQPTTAKAPHVPYFDATPGGITIRPHKVTVHELWYSANDATCRPSIRATTVWAYVDGTFSPRTTVRH